MSRRLFGGGLNNFSETYIDFGHPFSEVTGYERDLDLRSAVSTVRYTYNGVDYKREYFASYPDKAIVIRLEASGKSNLNFTLRPTIPFKQEYMVKAGDGYSKSGSVVASDDASITLFGNLGYNDIDFAAVYKVINEGGEVIAKNEIKEDGTPDNGTLTVKGAKSAYVVITLSTSVKLSPEVFTTHSPKEKFKTSRIDALATAKEELAEAMKYTYNELRERHIADYGNLFARAEVDLGGAVPSVTTDALLDSYARGERDKYLEELYFQFGRYLLICSSRPGTMPANLQGTWNRYNLAPWGSGYWHNVNVQMNYWPAFSTNLTETFEAYVDFWKAFLPQAQIFATKAIAGEKYESNLGLLLPFSEQANAKYLKNLGKDGGNGWTIGVGSQAFDISSSPGCGNIGFTTPMFWDYYDFTRSKEILRDTVYPALKGGSQYITKTFEKEPDGKYLSIWGDSPEQWVNGVWYYTKGTTYDQSSAYNNGRYTLDAAEILGIKATDEGESVLATVAEQMPGYDPIVIGYSGQIKEFREEKYYGELGEYAHRHVSQLTGLAPGNIINSKTPAWIDAAKYTLTERQKGAAADEWGWSLAYRQNLWARAGEGNEAYVQLKKLLSMRTATNLWSKTPAGFQIEANFGATAGIAEMLLQSQAGYIEPLAAVPDAWSRGSYSGLCARGGFEVSAKWSDGNAECFTFRSLSGSECTVKHKGLARARVLDADGSEIASSRLADDIISFATEAGKSYTVVDILPTERVDAPTALTVSRGDNGELSLGWTGSKDAVKYNVYTAINNDSTYTLVGTSDDVSFVLDGASLDASARITLKVSAVNKNGAESAGTLAYALPLYSV